MTTPPASAVPPAPGRAVVSTNMVAPDGEAHADPRPETFEAAVAASIHGVGVSWDGAQTGLDVGSGFDSRPIHPGLSTQPALGLHNPDTHLGGTAYLDLGAVN